MTLQGHKRFVLLEASGKFCPVCPSQICTREGRYITSYACHWCTTQPPTIAANRAFSSFSQVPCAFRETHINQDVTEWLISDSHSSVTPNQMGSNAYTIIAVYGAVNFLLPSTNWSLPSPQNLLPKLISTFKQLMLHGNQTYNLLCILQSSTA